MTTFERREMTEMTVNENFAKWATSYAGCDGGDIGTYKTACRVRDLVKFIADKGL